MALAGAGVVCYPVFLEKQAQNCVRKRSIGVKSRFPNPALFFDPFHTVPHALYRVRYG